MKTASIAIILILLSFLSCTKEIEPNKVDMDQINPDNSTNYEFIFKDAIKQDEKNKMRYKKKEF